MTPARPLCRLLAARFLLVLPALLAGISGNAAAATVTAAFTSASYVPVKAASYTASGNTVKVTLGFAPTTGTTLTIVRNSGPAFIAGQFSNLAQGQVLKLTYGGITYRYVADYFGGTGNDLVLQWANQEAWAWGYNDYLQLGALPFSGNGSLVPVPVTTDGVLAGKTVLHIAAGATHSVALCSDGTVAAWGRNTYGELGNVSADTLDLPLAVDRTGVLAGKTVVAVAAGADHSLALCSDGTVAAWGRNDQGQLGDGSLVDRTFPVKVVTTGALAGKSVVALAAGGAHSLALCSDGKVVAWGDNLSGDLGNGKTTRSTAPSAVKTTGALSGKIVLGIAAGVSHSLAVCSDGTVVAWGGNSRGQLGNGLTADTNLPVVVSAASGALKGKTAVAVGAGDEHSLAVCSDATAAAWGGNDAGQLGNNRTVDSNLPVAVRATGVLAGKTVVSVTGGSVHSLAVCSDGTAAAWGGNLYGMLGDGTGTTRLVPVAVSTGGDFAGRKTMAAAGGTAHTVVVAAAPLSHDSSLSGLALNGGVLSHGLSAALTHYGASVSDHSSVPITVTAATSNRYARLTIGGVAMASGSTSAEFPKSEALIPITVTAEDGSSTTYEIDLRLSHNYVASVGNGKITPVTAAGYMATGLHLSLAVSIDPPFGETLTLVDNTGLSPVFGEFLDSPQGTLLKLGTRSYVVNYFGGDGNDIVLVPRLRAVGGWGTNVSGVLGTGIAADGKVPVAVAETGVLSRKTVLSVASGVNHSLALCSDGTIAAWGTNSAGQLGDGTQTTRTTPVAVDRTGVLAGKTVVAIAAGSSYSLALCSDGTLAAWGDNLRGSLGNGTETGSSLPTAVDLSLAPGKRVVGISARGSFTIARCSDGTLLGWGDNTLGQLGVVGAENTTRPLEISRAGLLARKLIRQISAGGSHVLALATDGTAIAWGSSPSGQLGDGSTDYDPSLPLEINSFGALSGKSIVAVSAGYAHSLALGSDGTMVAWGANDSGQLGIGSTTKSPLPVLVNSSGALAGKTVSAISAGDNFSLAINSDGTVAAWGANNGRQLGDGTTSLRTSPVAVPQTGFLAGKKVIAVSAGANYSLVVAAVPYSSRLSSLTLNAGSLSPSFSPAVTDYFLSAPASVTSVAVTAITADYSATLSIAGSPAQSGVAFAPVRFSPQGQFRVTVTAEDWTQTEYIIHTQADFTAAVTSPVSANQRYTRYDATGWSANISLGYAPAVGDTLRLIENTDPDFIIGRFSNLAQGQPVDLTFAGKTYHFVANYYGGTGNDLVLEWAHRSIAGWGFNNSGQVGVAPIMKIPRPVAMTDLGILTGKTVTSVAAGAYFSIALCADGTLASWGGSASNLGAGGTNQSTVPIAVKTTGALAGKFVAGIAAAAGNSLAVCSDGSVVAWGDGGYGQLGNGVNLSSDEPVAAPLGGKSAVSVAVGGYHSLAVCSDGTVLAWGGNRYGQLGDGTTVDRNLPVPVSTAGVLAGKKVIAVTAGLEYSLALCSDGTLASWGSNDASQLGINFFQSYSSTPVLVDRTGVLAGETVIALSQASHSTPTVLCASGKVVTWGKNDMGQRGGNTGGQAYQPGFVSTTGALAGKSVASISSGGSSTVAICTDGAVVTWGDNFYGQLGNAGSSTAAPVSEADNGVLSGGKPLFAALAYHAVVVTAEPDDGYRGWAFGYGNLPQKGASADPDGDGISNLLEYVLHADPTNASPAVLPTVSADGESFVFHFNRSAESAAATAQVFETSTDMTAWTAVSLAVPAGAGVSLGATGGDGMQSVTVTLPKGSNTTMFGRLKVALP